MIFNTLAVNICDGLRTRYEFTAVQVSSPFQDFLAEVLKDLTAMLLTCLPTLTPVGLVQAVDKIDVTTGGRLFTNLAIRRVLRQNGARQEFPEKTMTALVAEIRALRLNEDQAKEIMDYMVSL